MTSRTITSAAGPTSRKRSDASSSSAPRPPEPPVHFIEEALGRHVIPHALRAAGARVEIHADHFRPGELDEVWLAEVARRGWIVLSKDLRIRYRGLALRAIEKTGARLFVLKRSESLTGSEMAEIFVRALPAIHRRALEAKGPYIVRVGRDGRVEPWWPESSRPRRA